MFAPEDKELLARVELNPLDRYFAKQLADLAPGSPPELLLAAALASRQRAAGHICLDLATVAGQPLAAEAGSAPSLAEWQAVLRRSPLVGGAGEYRPLILDGTRLYLQRYWQYEEEVAAFVRGAGTAVLPALDLPLLKDGLARLFPTAAVPVDWQRVAAVAAVLHPFCVISGGPGTGKTSTVAKILTLLLEQAGARGLHITLAGPTGKAASRLQEAIQAAKEKLASPWAAGIPTEAVTVHRLLGSSGGGRFRYTRDQPLGAEVVVVDEASMVDLPLMAALLAAIPKGGRLILLGDRDQLASVQPGAVLGDLCGPRVRNGYSPSFCALVTEVGGDCLSGGEGSGGALADAIIELRTSYRFGAASGIGAVSRAVNAGQVEEALAAFRQPEFSDLLWRKLPPGEPAAVLAEMVAQEVANHLAGLRGAGSPEEALAALSRFGILCALRQGPYGAEAINELVRRWLVRQGAISERAGHYPGRPLMITANDHHNHLYNGDIGIVFPDATAGGRLRVFFEDGRGGLRKVLPLRLPPHQSLYAMTVHKSQGSEFNEVLFLLPETVAPVLTRELLYTALTRARHRVTVVGREEVFAAGVATVCHRESGLREKL